MVNYGSAVKHSICDRKISAKLLVLNYGSAVKNGVGIRDRPEKTTVPAWEIGFVTVSDRKIVRI